ncbi:hypothetical protein L6164_035782 [Bauhinia variegata]|uniref:Uncharacterized protein n=1 Tax=Bauhinia variegata TaxID=167791 RepID=A0ACB9KF50_BAUVA|nr:hypothetical protein L6164_035782 [Bauhinia variegata]
MFHVTNHMTKSVLSFSEIPYYINLIMLISVTNTATLSWVRSLSRNAKFLSPVLTECPPPLFIWITLVLVLNLDSLMNFHMTNLDYCALYCLSEAPFFERKQYNLNHNIFFLLAALLISYMGTSNTIADILVR